MITKQIIGNELYVYHNGVLFFKKWLDTNQTIVLEKYGPPTRTGDRNK
jgi:hypothetical protein